MPAQVRTLQQSFNFYIFSHHEILWIFDAKCSNMIIVNVIVLIFIHATLVSSRLEAEILNWNPLISLFPHFLSDQECDFIIGLAMSHPRYISSSEDKSISIYFDEYPNLNEQLKHIGDINKYKQ